MTPKSICCVHLYRNNNLQVCASKLVMSGLALYSVYYFDQEKELNGRPKSNCCENFSVCDFSWNRISGHNFQKVSLLTRYRFLNSFHIVSFSETFGFKCLVSWNEFKNSGVWTDEDQLLVKHQERWSLHLLQKILPLKLMKINVLRECFTIE